MTYLKAGNEEAYNPAKHLSAHFREVQKLKSENRPEDAITSLLELVDATEEDSIFTGLGVASAYYEELARIFRARKEYAKEMAILARYLRQRHTPQDYRQEKLKARLEIARKLFIRNESSSQRKNTARQ